MKKLKRSTKNSLLKITAFVLFAAIVITNTVSLYASLYDEDSDQGEFVSEDAKAGSGESTENESSSSDDIQVEELESDDRDSSDTYWEEPEISDDNENESEETDVPGAASMPEEEPDSEEGIDADSTASPEADADADADADASPSITPKEGAAASPSVTPGKTLEAEASIGSSRYNISGTGLDEIIVSFDTETLEEEEAFGLVLFTDAENVSAAGNSFSQIEDGCYRIEGLQKGTSDIKFRNLKGNDFTISAEGTEVSFTYSVSNEVQKTGDGLSCKVSVAVSGGRSEEKAGATPAGSPSTTPSVMPTGSPSTTPSATPTGSPSATPSATPAGSPSATPSVTPADTSEVQVSINSSDEGITGMGLNELTVSFDTEQLNEEDTFTITLSAEAEGVSVSGSTFVQDGSSYRVEGLQKDASGITFRNLRGEDFTISAEGTEITFTYSASGNEEETEDGLAGNVTVAAASESEDDEKADQKELVLVNRTIAVVTEDGAFVKVSGLLPMGATVTAVPGNVEMEGKVVLAAYDITIWDADKNEYEITDTVKVTISNIGKLSGVSSDVIEIYHFGNGSTEAEKVAEVGIQDGNKLSFDADGFTIYAATTDELSLGDGTVNLLDIGTMKATLERTGTSDIVSRDEKLKLILDFTINPTDKTMLIENPTVIYPLPQELAGFPAGAYILRTEDGTPVGTYAVGAGNLLTIQFTNVEWVNKNSEFKGHIELSGELNRSLTENAESIEIEFEGEGNLKYQYTFGEGSASSSKTAWLDAGNGYIWFSLNVTPNMTMDLTVTDTLVGGVGEIDWDSFELWNSDTWQSEKITVEKKGESGFKYTIESAKVNTNYTIKYGVKIDKAAYDAGKVTNEAEWSWAGKTDTGKKDQVEVNLNKKWVTKWYVSHKTEKGYTFDWTVTVNDQEPKTGFSVAGKTISDTLSGEHQYNSDITITGTNGWSDTISAGQIAGKNGFTYTFPSEGTGGFQGDDVFTITYQTISTSDVNYDNYYEVHNAVDFDGGEDTAASGGWHLVNTNSGTKQDAYISKSFQNADFENGLLNWLINVDVEKGKAISNVKITDIPISWNISTHKVDLNSVVIALADGTELTKDADYSVEMNDNGECTIILKNKIDQSFHISISTHFDIGEINNDIGSCEYKNWVSMSYCLEDGSWGGYDQSEAGYTVKKEYNIKKEANGFNESDKTMEWKVMINPGSESYPDKIQYVLRDTLPANTSFVADSLKVYRYGLYYTSSEDITGNVSVSVIGGVLTITNLGNSDYIYEIIYKTKADDDYYLDENGNLKAGAVEFINVAELQDTAGSTLGKANAAQKISTEFLKKTSEGAKSEQDAYIHYTIEVNEDAMDMLPDDDYLDLEDIIPENLYLVLSTVTVTGTSDSTVSYDSVSRKLTIHVPDATHCTVTYDAMIIGNVGQWYSINNKVYLRQNKEIYAENTNSYQKYDATGNMTGTPGTITVQKVDANGFTTLPGAEFGLYRVPFKSDDGIKDIDLANAVRIGSGTTDSDGRLVFPTIDANYLYYLIEEKAPAGYELSTQKYYFARLSTDSAHEMDKVTFLAIMAANSIDYTKLSDSYGLMMSITNVKNNEAGTELKVKKNYNDTFPDGGFTFILTALGDAPMPEDAAGGSKTIQVIDSSAAETFGTIKYTSGGNYLYTIQEVIPDDAEAVADSHNKLKDGIIYDGRTYYVMVSVVDGEATVFGSADGANYDTLETAVFEFTNEKQKTGSINVRKVVSGKNTEESFYFTLADRSGALVERNGSTVFEVKAGRTVEVRDLPEGTYTLTETDVNGNDVAKAAGFPYEVSYSGQNIAVSSGTVQEATITNKVVTVDIKGTKEWDDANDQDGLRPGSITVKLLKDGVDTGKTATASAPDWNWSFTGLDRYENGTEISYSVEEVAIEDYEPAITKNGDGTYTIKNTHESEKTSVSVTKEWDDANNQDGIRPSKVTVHLTKNGITVQTVVLNEGNNWQHTWTDLAKYEGGEEIAYGVTEETVAGYSTEISGDIEAGFTVTNSYTPGKTSLSVEKVWVDADDQDSIRPDSIQVQLKAGGENKGSAVTLNAANGWTYTWENLPEKSGGNAITYTVSEVNVPKGYKVSYSGQGTAKITVTNTHEAEKTGISGNKEWDDANNQDGIRPDSITVNLLKNGAETGETATASAPDWSFSFTDLDKYENGTEIRYSVEEAAIEGYEPAITKNEDGTYTIKNTHESEKTSVSVKKEWDDANNQDGIRPSKVTVYLTKDGTSVQKVVLNEENNWQYTWTDLDRYENGEKIEYSVTEDVVADYSTEITGDMEAGFTVTNSYTPGKTSLSVEKVWVDTDDQDGIRPDSIQVQLKADGVNKGSAVTLNAANGWTYTWENLPEKNGGNAITYTVSEVNVPKGYKVNYSGQSTAKITVTNTHEAEKTGISGNKEWNDANNQDGIRPSSITVNLLKNGEDTGKTATASAPDWSFSFTDLDKYENGTEISYSVKEAAIDGYTSAVTENEDGTYTIKNTHGTETTDISVKKEWDDADNQDGIRPDGVTVYLTKNGTTVGDAVELNERNNWQHTWADLAKYEGGTKIAYGVTEEAVADYSTEITGNMEAGFTVKNSYTPGETSISVEKVWVDADDQDGIRPDSIQVQLKADEADKGEKITLNAENSWTHTWSGLPKKSGGKDIVYTVEEIEVPDGYEVNYSGQGTAKITVTNTHEAEKTGISGNKEWDDANNQDGIRPSSITVNLLKNGEDTGKTATASAPDWSFSFTDLAKYENGTEISYSVKEAAIDGYTPVVTENEDGTYTIKNPHETETTDISVKKEWDDANNQDGIRPGSVTVHLIKNGTAVVDDVELNERNSWQHTWTDLDKYEDGEEIVYSVTEETVADYSTEITGNMEAGFTVKNSYTPGETSISVEKVWIDADNQDGRRADSIQVQLKADGINEGSAVTLNAANGWQHTWSNLPEKSSGKDIVYTVEEVEVPEGYKVIYSGQGTAKITVTNTHETEKTGISGNKEWDDANNQDGIRPSGITVKLLKNGAETGETAIVSAPDWSFSFTDLDKYENGTEISYSVKEAAIEGYASTVTENEDGTYTIKNTHETETTDISVRKEWDDADNQDGIRPDGVTVYLTKNGTTVGDAVELNAGNNWQHTWADLAKYEGGTKIAYGVTEETVADYSTEITGNMEAGFTVKNSYTPGETSISVEKVWIDADNQDGRRADSIQVQLKADGINEGSAVTLNAANGWQHTWSNLPEKSGGKDIVYTVEEVEVPEGYEVSYSDPGTAKITVTNTYEPETVSISGSKEWDDADNQDGKRPASITVNLLKNGKVTEQTTTAIAPDWSFSFTDLDKYENGKEISYSVKEAAIEGYASTVAENEDGTYTITNMYTPETTSISGTKTWDDNNNENGARPESITIHLWKGTGDNKKEVTSMEVEPDADGNWSWSFTDLPKYEEGRVGEEIVYTISEDKVTDYTATINGYNVTNTYTPDETFVIVTKEWVEADNYTDIRPAEITVQLYEDKLFDKKVGDPVVLNEENNWTYKWEHLPVRKSLLKVNYTVKEVDTVTGYTTAVSEDTENNIFITNTLETVKVEGVKKWVGDTEQDRPERIIIRLKADDVEVQVKEVTSADDWKWSFTDLPKYKKIGNEIKGITYTISEDEVGGYATAVDGYNVTNTKEVTSSPTPIITPGTTETPGTSPEVTPGSTPGASPEATPGSTPGTPESTPGNPPEETPDNPPGDTPSDEPPGDTPENNVEPAPTPDNRQVLGAKRMKISASEAAVLGARRGLDRAVLGRRRRPSTGDSMAIIIWIIIAAMSFGGVLTSTVMLTHNKKYGRRK